MLSNMQIIWIAFFCGVYAGVLGFAVALIATNRTPEIQPTIEEEA